MQRLAEKQKSLLKEVKGDGLQEQEGLSIKDRITRLEKSKINRTKANQNVATNIGLGLIVTIGIFSPVYRYFNEYNEAQNTLHIPGP